MFKKNLLLLYSCLIIHSASAASGGYVAANLGYASIQNWWTAALALTINGGYNFNNYFATEAGVTWVTPISSNYSTSGGTPSSYTQNQSFIDMAAKGSLPFSDIFNLYAKAGLGLAYSSASSIANSSAYNWNGATSTLSPGIYLALGGELKLSKALQATFEDYGLMPLENTNWGNINVFALGLKYNF